MIIKIGSSHSICSEKSASLTAPDSKFITIRENFDHLIRMSGARTALRDVVALLENPDGVHAFRNWLSIDPARTIDALDLYLALRGLSLLIENEDPNSQRTACHIHRKYISLRTGSCHFLPHDARLEMSSRIHSLPPSLPTFSPPLPPIDLFSPIHDHLHNHLSYLHSQFITTKLFHDFVHMVTSTSSFDVQEATTSYPTIQRSMQAIEIEESDGEREEIERNELNGGGGIVGMDKPPIVPPHRSFTFNTVKRKRVKVPLLVEPTPFRHDRPEGRLHFAAVLSEKLDHLRMEIAQQRNEDEKNAFKKPAFEETTSDEEVAKYAERMNERRRSASCSPPSTIPLSVEPLGGLYGPKGFAPPPQAITTNPFKHRIDLTTPRRSQPRHHEVPPSDSSGFCSAESAFCDRSIDRKAQEFPISPFNRRDRSRDAHRRFTFGTIPRPQRISKDPQTTLTITLREISGSNSIPLVARVPANPPLTYREFRRLFGIRKDSRKRLFFKSPCDDGSAPFQWNLLFDDSDFVPTFGTQIFAESRPCLSEDSD